MLDILDYTSERILRIITMLVVIEDEITVKVLSDKLYIPIKIIYRDLEYIKKICTEEVEFIEKKDGRIMIKNCSNSSFLNIKSNVLLESKYIQLIMLLINRPNKKLNYYVDTLYISRSSLHRYVIQINLLLDKYKVSIKNENDLLVLKGDTETIYSTFCSTLIFELNNNKINDYIPSDWCVFLKKRIQNLFKLNNISIIDYFLNYYIIWYYFFIKNSFTDSFKNLNIHNNNNLFIMSSEEIDYIENCDLGVSREQMLNIERLIFNQVVVSDSVKKELKDKSNQCVNYFFNIFNLSKNDKKKAMIEEYLISIYNRITYSQIPFSFFYDRFSVFSKNIEINHKNIFIKIKKCIDYYSNILSINLSPYTDYIVYIMVMVVPEILYTRIVSSLIIISLFSEEHSRFLFERIKQNFNIDDDEIEKVVCIDKSNLKNYELEKFDLVISNVDLKTKNAEFILVDNFINKCSSDKLEKYIFL